MRPGRHGVAGRCAAHPGAVTLGGQSRPTAAASSCPRVTLTCVFTDVFGFPSDFTFATGAGEGRAPAASSAGGGAPAGPRARLSPAGLWVPACPVGAGRPAGLGQGALRSAPHPAAASAAGGVASGPGEA